MVFICSLIIIFHAGEKVWWRKLPEREEPNEPALKSDIGTKQKNFLDPLKDVKKYLGCEHESLSLKKHVVEEKPSMKRKRSSSPGIKKKKKEKKRKRKSSKRKYSESDTERRKRKQKKRKYSTSSDSEEEDRNQKKQNLERLRKQRLEREKKEREKANRLLHGEPKEEKSSEKAPTLKQSYNSQFNPTIARQNKLDPKQKDWLQ